MSLLKSCIQRHWKCWNLPAQNLNLKKRNSFPCPHHKALKRTKLWLEGDAFQTSYTHSQRYRSAKCLLCGCCLEVCPNFDPNSEFAGAVLPVNAYRILNEEQDIAHQTELANAYRQLYFEGCGKSLACQDICPAGIPVEELMSRSNAAAVWKR